MVALLTAHFQPGSYDLLRKNCNSFSSPLSAMIQWQKLSLSHNSSKILERSSLPKQENWQQDIFKSLVGKVSLDDACLHKCCCHYKAARWNIWWIQRSLDANNARMTDGWWSCFDFLYLRSENLLVWTVWTRFCSWLDSKSAGDNGSMKLLWCDVFSRIKQSFCK